jgi:beta-glucosidase
MPAGDAAVIARPIDFLGINYYFPQRIRADPGRPPVDASTADARPPTTSMGWEVDADGLRRLLARLRDDYGPLPVYITENGAAFEDRPPDNGVVHDDERTAYLSAHLRCLSAAIAEGADVRRYCVWSLLDNFEWEHGYDMRFGIVHVDYATQRRVPKSSGLWYRDFIAQLRDGGE